MKITNLVLYMALCVILIAPVSFASNNSPVATSIKANSNIKIDGKLNDPIWQKAKKYSNFHKLSRRSLLPAKKNPTYFQVAYNKQAIYFAFTCKQNYMPDSTKEVAQRDGSVWKNDDVEIFLAPGGKYYYQFAVNSIGTRFDQRLLTYTGNERPKNSKGIQWDGVWQAVTKQSKDKWTCEVRIPFATLGLSAKTLTTWKMNIGRTIRCNVTYVSWAPVQHGFADFPNFGQLKRVSINKNKFVVSGENLKFPAFLLGNNKIKLSLPVTGPGSFLVYTSLSPWQSNVLSTDNQNIQRVHSSKGQLQINFTVPVKEAGKQKNLILAIADAKTRQPIFLRSHLFKIPVPFQVSLSQIIYFTSTKTAKLTANILLSSTRGQITASIFRNNKLIAKHNFSVDTLGKHDFNLPINNLSTGRYNLKITARLKGLSPVTRKLFFYRLPEPFEN